jgi:hypothetical protein
VVWGQLDHRFKAPEDINIEGPKARDERKITWKAFEKAVERLDKRQVTFEKMTFGIKGNLLLLMNVLKIIGVNDLSELSAEQFHAPDTMTKLAAIDGKLDLIIEEINRISDCVDLLNKNRPRITASKADNDFKQLTKRLSSVLSDNSDVYIDSNAVNDAYKKFELLLNLNMNKQDNTIKDYQGLMKDVYISKQFHTGNNFYDRIVTTYLSSHSSENKRVLYLFNIIMEYKEYCRYHKIMRKYYGLLNNPKYFTDDISNYKNTVPYILSPLYMTLFYLLVSSHYIDKIRAAAIDTKDETVRERIRQTGSAKTAMDYFYIKTNGFIKQVARILRVFPDPNKELPSELYYKYKKILESIVKVYKTSLVDIEEPSDNDIKNSVSGIRNISELFSVRALTVSGRYILIESIMDDYDKLENDLSVLARNTLRDING